MTLSDVEKEVKKRLRKAEFEMSEFLMEHGEPEQDSLHWGSFLYAKGTLEALQGVVWFLDPNYER